MNRLPIYELEAELLHAVAAHGRLIIQAPTGSGKSTQIPQILLAQGALERGQAVVLQPRRLAARLLARRVAEELHVPLGREVGYQVRFEHVASPQTRIRYVTEGILLRQMIQDPLLEGIQVLLFDEFHERHLYGDITLAQALELQTTTRPDLQIIVMSATLDAGLLQNYLAPCRSLSSTGRTFPVDVAYLPGHQSDPSASPAELAAAALAEHVAAGYEGDVLIFMPGSYEINQTLAALRAHRETAHFLTLPLHGELSPDDQDAAVARYDRPKVVVATNVAETSITIDGVRLVIDSGLARVARYDPHRGINTLLIERISRASADQRAGRAGRTAPGRCIRLWAPDEARPAHDLPEVRRLDLAEVVLTLKAAGVVDLRRFRWLEPPSEIALEHAEELLADLGAIRPDPPPATPQPTAAPDPELPAQPLRITELGRTMLAFPVHPRYSRMLLAAQDYHCVPQACLIAALTQGRDLLLRKPGRDVNARRDDLLGEDAPSDFWILIRAWNHASRHQFRPDVCRRLGIHALSARQVGPLCDQFLRIAREEGLDTQPGKPDELSLLKCILMGFSDRVARRLDSGTLRCELVHGRHGVLARESVVQQSPLLVAAEVHEIEGADKTTTTLLSLATAIEAAWLLELFPGDITRSTHVAYDASARRVTAEEQLRFRDLVIETRRLATPPPDAAARLLADEIEAGRLRLTRWDHAVDQWILRLNLLCGSCPELGLPPITDPDRRTLLEQICHGAAGYRDLKDREVHGIVFSWLSIAQRALLDRHAPERLTLSNGRTPKVVYGLDGPPHIALRIQELYDVQETPRIAMGRVPVVVHILAPNMRPVQITQDLARFWREHYPRAKSDLQRKYPKHTWR
ncbi:MAG TPA: ATP-dependent helicase HrpB [Verrucomicrobiota bacterium]|nr:ATP-dependent helicase HrpB [Verrucomicrobiota bacterium]HNU52877.1 ATP-dependent helicase HrpB [Verrucomicrobiota bacterium]